MQGVKYLGLPSQLKIRKKYIVDRKVSRNIFLLLLSKEKNPTKIIKYIKIEYVILIGIQNWCSRLLRYRSLPLYSNL